MTQGSLGAPATERVKAWSLRRWVTLISILAVVVTVGAIVGGGAEIVQLKAARDSAVKQLNPAAQANLRLSNALVNQETGVRGFAFTGQEDFLAPYTQALSEQAAATADLRAALGDRFPGIQSDLDRVLSAAEAWQRQFAEPTIARVRTSGPIRSVDELQQGKALFDALRATSVPLDRDLRVEQTRAQHSLDRSASELAWVAVAIGVALLAGTVFLIVGLIRGVNRPVKRINKDAQTVASGDFEHEVEAVGPREIRQLAGNVETMRVRILAELSEVRDARARLETQAADLERSNSELEQFAYVASHDLQEPLRKVASFCELLETRYNDALDERGRQYIAFAVDGATRMQALINDLLSFSRVGRGVAEHTAVDMNQVFATATTSLSTTISETHAKVTAGKLPVINGDSGLLTAVVANLIGNGIKFHRPDIPPVITVTARGRSDDWLFTVADNGIGIESDYADRIFVIFQRLHPKSAYPGTGIGLAMCRKIIEFHGGQIWLDTSNTEGGSHFQFTLPRRTAADIRQAIARQAALTNGSPS